MVALSREKKPNVTGLNEFFTLTSFPLVKGFTQEIFDSNISKLLPTHRYLVEAHAFVSTGNPHENLGAYEVAMRLHSIRLYLCDVNWGPM